MAADPAYTRAPVLGKFHEISLETADIAESVAFYERLGFTQVGTNDTWQHPYGVLTDGKLFLGLHQFKFPSPTLTYVRQSVASHVHVIEKLGIAHVTAQRVHRAVPALVRQFKDAGAGLRGRGDESCPQVVPGEDRGVEPRQLGAAFDAGSDHARRQRRVRDCAS